MSIQGVIFDLDGTLVESQLDFQAIRSDLGLPEDQPVLEAIAMLPDAEQRRDCARRLHEFEEQAALGSVLMSGARELVAEIDRRGLPQGILTRNSRVCAELTLRHHGLPLQMLITRDDGLSPKPAPDGILHICQTWDIAPQHAMMIGDFVFDLRAARAAGAAAVLFAPETEPHWSSEADYVVRHLSECLPLLDSVGD